jgi:putative transposase
MRHHSVHEISAKLRQAEEMMARGQSQVQVCKTLGVSVMTFHRWRKRCMPLSVGRATSPESDPPSGAEEELSSFRAWPEQQFDELRTQNERLKRIVADLLLEKAHLQEQLAFLKLGTRRIERH